MAKGAITAKVYALFERAVEEGIRYGLQRCAKYEIAPSSEAGVEQIMQGVMLRVDEDFSFPDP